MHKNLREDAENNTADELIANLEKDCKGNYIKLSVEPSAELTRFRFLAPGTHGSF